ncbi:pilus assembly protein [Propioniciclava soli]|uniref:pilus assembly protein n=1 Tax=Propioniciclava soli TaxID=2775081 RepID=UPI001E4D64D8|nr:pilus assembly protein [Propioniciclava soli]
MLLSVVTFVIIIGISVDLGGRMYALQRINDVAAEAARTGSQQVDVASAMRGRSPRVDPGNARSAAQAYIATAGYTGTVSVSGDVLHVTVTGTHTPVFLPAFGPVSLTGEAQARLVRAQNGEER